MNRYTENTEERTAMLRATIRTQINPLPTTTEEKGEGETTPTPAPRPTAEEITNTAKTVARETSLQPHLNGETVMVYMNPNGEVGCIFYAKNTIGWNHVVKCNGFPTAAYLGGKRVLMKLY